MGGFVPPEVAVLSYDECIKEIKLRNLDNQNHHLEIGFFLLRMKELSKDLKDLILNCKIHFGLTEVRIRRCLNAAETARVLLRHFDSTVVPQQPSILRIFSRLWSEEKIVAFWTYVLERTLGESITCAKVEGLKSGFVTQESAYSNALQDDDGIKTRATSILVEEPQPPLYFTFTISKKFKSLPSPLLKRSKSKKASNPNVIYILQNLRNDITMQPKKT